MDALLGGRSPWMPPDAARPQAPLAPPLPTVTKPGGGCWRSPSAEPVASTEPAGHLAEPRGTAIPYRIMCCDRDGSGTGDAGPLGRCTRTRASHSARPTRSTSARALARGPRPFGRSSRSGRWGTRPSCPLSAGVGRGRSAVGSAFRSGAHRPHHLLTRPPPRGVARAREHAPVAAAFPPRPRAARRYFFFASATNRGRRAFAPSSASKGQPCL